MEPSTSSGIRPKRLAAQVATATFTEWDEDLQKALKESLMDVSSTNQDSTTEQGTAEEGGSRQSTNGPRLRNVTGAAGSRANQNNRSGSNSRSNSIDRPQRHQTVTNGVNSSGNSQGASLSSTRRSSSSNNNNTNNEPSSHSRSSAAGASLQANKAAKSNSKKATVALPSANSVPSKKKTTAEEAKTGAAAAKQSHNSNGNPSNDHNSGDGTQPQTSNSTAYSSGPSTSKQANEEATRSSSIVRKFAANDPARPTEEVAMQQPRPKKKKSVAKKLDPLIWVGRNKEKNRFLLFADDVMPNAKEFVQFSINNRFENILKGFEADGAFKHPFHNVLDSSYLKKNNVAKKIEKLSSRQKEKELKLNFVPLCQHIWKEPALRTLKDKVERDNDEFVVAMKNLQLNGKTIKEGEPKFKFDADKKKLLNEWFEEKKSGCIITDGDQCLRGDLWISGGQLGRSGEEELEYLGELDYNAHASGESNDELEQTTSSSSDDSSDSTQSPIPRLKRTPSGKTNITPKKQRRTHEEILLNSAKYEDTAAKQIDKIHKQFTSSSKKTGSTAVNNGASTSGRPSTSTNNAGGFTPRSNNIAGSSTPRTSSGSNTSTPGPSTSSGTSRWTYTSKIVNGRKEFVQPVFGTMATRSTDRLTRGTEKRKNTKNNDAASPLGDE